jgi:hypothetical protein
MSLTDDFPAIEKALQYLRLRFGKKKSDEISTVSFLHGLSTLSHEKAKVVPCHRRLRILTENANKVDNDLRIQRQNKLLVLVDYMVKIVFFNKLKTYCSNRKTLRSKYSLITNCESGLTSYRRLKDYVNIQNFIDRLGKEKLANLHFSRQLLAKYFKKFTSVFYSSLLGLKRLA